MNGWRWCTRWNPRRDARVVVFGGAWLRYVAQCGRTIAFADHADGWSWFNVSNITFDERNQAMISMALRAGYDSIQFLSHTCAMMYEDCLDRSLLNLTYFNLEVVSTHLVGIYACGSEGGSSPLLRTGWPQGVDGRGSTPCTCDNSKSNHLHCSEVPDSLVMEAAVEANQSRPLPIDKLHKTMSHHTAAVTQ